VANPFDNVAAAILAGGLGTRLRSVVADRPKVLADVGGRPFLSYLLDQLARAGVRETVLLVGYGADQIRATFGDEYTGMRLAYSGEPEPLGTGGALRRALPLFQQRTVLLLNGDSYCDADLLAFQQFQQAPPGCPAMVLAHVDDASRYGRVEVEPGGRVIRFVEKGGDRSAGQINAGLYLVPRELVAAIPAGRPVSLEREALPAWVGGGGLRGFPGGRFIDIGTPASYAAAEAFFRTPGRD
jgi:NDP-sugar pyrophosphorylase family protein